MKLNVGCGRNILDGWVNLDIMDIPDVDLVHDVQQPLPYPDDTFTHIYVSHLLEHLPDPLQAMENLWRVAQPDCQMQVVVPFGGSDEAWEDQTHLRAYFPRSFYYFSQPAYRNADYGYEGDWESVRVIMEVWDKYKDIEDLPVYTAQYRNVCRNLIVDLRAVKPARPRELTDHRTAVGFTFVPMPGAT